MTQPRKYPELYNREWLLNQWWAKDNPAEAKELADNLNAPWAPSETKRLDSASAEMR